MILVIDAELGQQLGAVQCRARAELIVGVGRSWLLLPGFPGYVLRRSLTNVWPPLARVLRQIAVLAKNLRVATTYPSASSSSGCLSRAAWGAQVKHYGPWPKTTPAGRGHERSCQVSQYQHCKRLRPRTANTTARSSCSTPANRSSTPSIRTESMLNVFGYQHCKRLRPRTANTTARSSCSTPANRSSSPSRSTAAVSCTRSSSLSSSRY
jgi:hypothetical protein